MSEEKKFTMIRFLLSVLVLLTFCLIQIMRNEQFASYAQESLNPDSSDIYGEPIQLNSFTFWDHVKIGLLAYINPHASTERSLIFVYELADQEDFETVLNNIPESSASQWVIGWAEQDADNSRLTWTPTMLNEFRAATTAMATSDEFETQSTVNNSELSDIVSSESNIDNIIQLYATNLPIGGRELYDTYWIPYSDFRERFDDSMMIAEQ